MIEIHPGLLLISDPFLKDPNFKRSIVLVCEHQIDGSLGFVLNKLYDQDLHHLVTDLEGFNFPLFYGGPVQKDTLHFLHTRPDLIEDGMEIRDGIYWGGDFELVVNLIKDGLLTPNDLRFFIGYSNWTEGQLEEELETKSWITRDATKRLVFNKNIDETWKDALKDLGGEYSQMIHYPLDPQLN